MPSGVLLVAERTITLAGTIQPTPQRVLDVGAGYGKHGVLLREYLDPTPVVHGVEAWEPYVDAHRLRGIYDELFIADILSFDEDRLATYDLVVMGDVIEHIERDAALALIDRIPGWVVIATPVDHFDTGPGLPPTEAHVSHWTYEDFIATGRCEHWEMRHGALIVRLSPRS